jgi:hypothetical protein
VAIGFVGGCLIAAPPSSMIGRMKKDVDERLQAVLLDLRYARVKKNLFRAPWSSEAISHYISTRWLHRFGYDARVDVGVGIRHHEAQAFALAMNQRFGDPRLRGYWKVGPTDSVVGFPFGKLCSWPMFAVVLSDLGVEGSVRQVIDGLEMTLRPLVRDIGDDAAMYDFLTQTKNEAMWPANGAVRASEAIFLGKRLGYPQGKVMSEIEPFRMFISSQIDRTTTVDDYLSQAWARA